MLLLDSLVNNSLGELKFLPDYANAIKLFNNVITSSTSYTAPENGILILRWYVTDEYSNDCFASINGNKVAETGAKTISMPQIFVNKGDVIQFVINNAKINTSSIFVPFK